MRRLTILSAALLSLLLLPCPIYPERYFITEEQLEKLETEQKTQKELAMSLKSQLEEQEKYCKKLESRSLKTSLQVGIVSFGVGFAAGAVTLLIIRWTE